MNLFSLAPKELTNSAIWAWILHSLCETSEEAGPRQQIAMNLLARLQVPVPNSGDIHEIQTEKVLPTLQRPACRVKGQNRRIDVFLRTKGENPFVFFIENKVVEQENQLAALLEQIEGYDSYFETVRRVDPSYASIVYPAYFGYEPDTADRLIALAKKKGSSLAERLRCCPASVMLEAFAGTDFVSDPILKNFHDWLQSRRKFIEFRAAARAGCNVPVEDVIEASRELGFSELLNAFWNGLQRCQPVHSQISLVRVDVRNINFFRGGATPLTVRWYYDSGRNGLYVGLHENFASIMGRPLPTDAIPPGFAYEKESNWLYGYFQSAEEIDRFWRVIGGCAPALLPLAQKTETAIRPNLVQTKTDSIAEIFALAKTKGLSLKSWTGSRLATYNGFDHDQRVRKWQALDLSIRLGLEPPAERFPCSVCGAPPSLSIAYHSEDYGAMNGHHPVCKSCHTRLHKRFSSPENWRSFVATVGDGTKWFEKLTIEVGSIPMASSVPPELPMPQIFRSSVPAPTPIAQPGGSIRQQMQAVHVDFVRAMGISSQKMNPNPVGGYKLEHDPIKRQQCLDEAKRLRDRYAELVRKSGAGRDILEKMDSNLANRDLRAVWR